MDAGAAVPAESRPTGSPSALPLADVLGADGRLDLPTGFNGALDPAGYRMELAPDGAPVFAPETNEPNSRLNSWHVMDHGVNAQVHAIAAAGRNVYVGGYFPSASGVPNTSYIARWDGSSWNALGDGLNGPVFSIEIVGDEVYVGGEFTNAGDNQYADYIARWHGTFWLPLGYGLPDSVYDIEIIGSKVYVGGGFTDAAGLTAADYLAVWDRETGGWNVVGQTLTGYVRTIAHSGSTLFIGGDFINAGGNSNADHVAFIDTLQDYPQAWQALGSGLDDAVYNLEAVGSDLYAAGDFWYSGIDPIIYIGRWDGSAWNRLPNWLTIDGPLQDIEIDGPNLYAAGRINFGGGVARFNNGLWSTLAEGFDGVMLALDIIGGVGYIGGAFQLMSGDFDANGIVRWTSAETNMVWQDIGGPIIGPVRAITVAGSNVYLGGAFSDAAGIPGADSIARWDGRNWHALGGGLNGTVYSIAVEGSWVYAGGEFHDAGGILGVDHIAVFTGSSWSAVHSGVNGAVRAILPVGKTIYIGGDFTDAGDDLAADHIARWEHTGDWQPVGDGLNGRVNTLAEAGQILYAGGEFTDAGGSDLNDYLARYYSGTWTGISGNMIANQINGAVRTIEIVGPDLYVGGDFTNAGSLTYADYIARFDGTDWHELHFGMFSYPIDAPVNDILSVGPYMLVAGEFHTGLPHLASWNGTVWNSIPGVDEEIYTIQTYGLDFLAGGEFEHPGGDIDANHVARWGSEVTETFLPLIQR